MSEEVKNKSEYLVEVRDLKQYFPIKTGFMKTTPLKAVDGVSFSIKPGETLGLVGESSRLRQDDCRKISAASVYTDLRRRLFRWGESE